MPMTLPAPSAPYVRPQPYMALLAVLAGTFVVSACEDARAPRAPGGGSDSVAVTTSTGAGANMGVGGMGVGGMGSGANAQRCDYPAGPYGVEVGDTLPQALAWQGIVAGGDSITTIAVDSLFDCDGTRGIRAVLIDSSQYG